MKPLLMKTRKILLLLQAKLIFLPCLATRLMVGYGFYATGKGKLNNLERVANWFDSMGIPFPEAQAWFVGHLEYYGGILLVLGLFTRPIAVLLASTMVVALATADREGFLASWTQAGEQLPVEITAFTYLVFLGWLIYFGSGQLGLDTIFGFFLKDDEDSEEE